MFGRMRGRKIKVSVSLSASTLASVDRPVAREKGSSRSRVIDEWLRGAVRERALADLESEIVAYYTDLRSAAEAAEDRAIAEASGRAARELGIDAVPARPRRKA